MTEKRKNYTAEFKRAAVDLVTEQGYSMSQASRRLDSNVNMLRLWKHQFEEQGNDSFPGKGYLNSAAGASMRRDSFQVALWTLATLSFCERLAQHWPVCPRPACAALPLSSSCRLGQAVN